MSKPFRVHKVVHRDGRRSHWVFSAEGELHRGGVEVLKRFSESTQETYAYGLADHLNWLHANRLSIPCVTKDDLLRYMNALTGQGNGVFGTAWRDRPPIGASAGSNSAAIVKAFYLESSDTPEAVRQWLSGTPVRMVRSGRPLTSNPLAPRQQQSRPRFLPDEVVSSLLEPAVLTSAREGLLHGQVTRSVTRPEWPVWS